MNRIKAVKFVRGVLFVLIMTLFIQTGMVGKAAEADNWQKETLVENGVVLRFPEGWSIFVNKEGASASSYADKENLMFLLQSFNADAMIYRPYADAGDMMIFWIAEADSEAKDYADMDEAELQKALEKDIYDMSIALWEQGRTAIFRNYLETEDEVYVTADVYVNIEDGLEEDGMTFYHTVHNGQEIWIATVTVDEHVSADEFETIIAELDVLNTNSSFYYILGYLEGLFLVTAIVVILIVVIVKRVAKSNQKEQRNQQQG